MVYEKLRSMLARQLELDESEITMDTNIIEDLGADSLDVVELLMSLENEYGIYIEDDEVAGLYTVRQVVAFMESKI